jgi:hypothetical protein
MPLVDLEALRTARTQKSKAVESSGSLDLAALQRARVQRAREGQGPSLTQRQLSAEDMAEIWKLEPMTMPSTDQRPQIIGESAMPVTIPPEGLLVPDKPVGVLDRAKQAIRERTGYFEPPIEGPQYREEHPFKTLAGMAAFYTAEALSGLGLNVPDIIAQKTKGDESLAASVNRITGFRPTPKEVTAGEVLQFTQGLKTAGKISSALIERIAARQALKNILAAGVAFGTRKATEEVADKIIRNDPIDVEGIQFESGVGILFGTGEEGARQFARFIRGLRAGRGIEKVTTAGGGEVDSRAAARQEINDALREYKQTGDRTEWDRVRAKYTGAPVPGEVPQATKPAAEPTPLEAAKPEPTPETVNLTRPQLTAGAGPSRNLARINTSVGPLLVPQNELTGNVQDDLERIFEYGNIGGELGIEQSEMKRSLSVGDTVEYGGLTYRVRSQGFTKEGPQEIPPALPGQTPAPSETAVAPVAKPAEPSRPTGIVSLRVADIHVAPQRFQFKVEGIGPEGVTERLAEVEKWNPKTAGTILVWQDKAGSYFVVDGHHRLALAKKLGVENINAFVVREADGVSDANARVLGAMSNLANEKGTPIDAAKVFRDSSITIARLKAEGVDVKNELVRQGLAMKGLSDEVFRMVIDQKVPANMAAKIGENVTNPTQQMQVAEIIASGGVETVREAELLARTIDSAPVLSKTTQTLFGKETTAKSLYAERAKVLANVEQHLKTHKKVFGVLASKSGMIEAKGNVLAKEANVEAKQRADEILYLLEKLVNAKGPVSDSLNRATIEYAKNPTKQRLAEVTADLLKQWEGSLTVARGGEVREGLLEPPEPPVTPPGTQGRLDIEALRKANEERRRMGGFSPLPVDMARELVAVARKVKDDSAELLGVTWKFIRRNLRTGTGYMRTLGGGGKLLARDLDTITFQMTKKGNRDLADLRLAYKGLGKQQREQVAQILNERVPAAGQTKQIMDRVNQLRTILDRSMNEAAVLGVTRLVRGEEIPLAGSGKAFPQVPNAKGIEFLKEARSQGKASARVFAWASEQVKAGRFANVDEAISALQDFRERQLRGVNPYLERSRVELPTDMIEWDGAKILPNIIERNWLTIEGIRQWGLDEAGRSFPRVRSRIERIRNEHGPGAADCVHDFIASSFGLQSGASREAQAISNKVRGYQFVTKVAVSPLTIVRNMTDRLAKGMMTSVAGTVEALAKYPPFVNAFIRTSQRIEDEMIRRGAIFSRTTLGEAYEAGGAVSELARTPFMESERGNQVFEAVVAHHALMRDLSILERDRPGSLGRIMNRVDYVFGRGKAQAAYRVGPRLMKKLKAGQALTDDDISQFLHEAVSNQAFPMILTSKPIWWDAHPIIKIFAQFKTWPLRQADLIWEDVLKYTVKTGDFTRLIGFLTGVLIAGEIYNIGRDLLFGKDESLLSQARKPAKDRELGRAIINDLLDGGVVGVVADLAYGINDWAGGVTVQTGKNLLELAGHVKKTPGLTLPALDRLLRKEVAPYRQILAALNKIDEKIDPENISGPYVRWRAAAHQWNQTQEHQGVLGAAESYTDDLLFGKPEYPIGENTLAYQLATRQIVAGDIEDAAKYIRYILKHSSQPPIKIREGLKQSINRQSPLGPIPDADLPRFLAGLSPTERQKALAVNTAFTSNYVKAVALALSTSRPMRDMGVEDTGPVRQQKPARPAPRLDLDGLKAANQKRKAG